ncbi:MAG: hypothetical protein AB1796_01850 [Bacillota bacterium]
MKRVLLFLLTAALLLSSSGCTVVEETHAFAESFPDKHWEKVWVIKERETAIAMDEEQVVLEGHCLIHYVGEEPAHDVSIIIRSPLTYGFIDDQMTRHYGTVNPGDKLEYKLHAEYAGWQDKVPVYIFADKIKDDYLGNFYVGISWRYGDYTYNKKFFDWSGEKH